MIDVYKDSERVMMMYYYYSVQVPVAFWSFFNTEDIWPIVFLLPTSTRIHLQRRHASYNCARPLQAKASKFEFTEIC